MSGERRPEESAYAAWVFFSQDVSEHSLFTAITSVTTLSAVLLQLHHPPKAVRPCLVFTACLVATFTLRAGTGDGHSPVPERVAARDAWRMAESLAASGQNYEVVVGRGGSMLPLYPDGTVLLLQRVPMADLRGGMTVVFIGDSGRPVAHALLQKTWRGWLAKGLNNPEPDRTLVRTSNYLGTVVRAFTPVIGLGSTPMSDNPAASGQ